MSGDLAAALTSLSGARVERDLSLASLTTYEVGGPADWVVFPRTPEALAQTVRVVRAADERLQVLGRGSNVLIGDRGIRGVVIVLRELESVRRDGTRIHVGAGADCTAVAAVAREAGLAGIEFFHYLPGSVGGAAFMNARAFDREMSQVWRGARLVDGAGQLVERRYEADQFSYKKSPLQGAGEIAAELELHLVPDDPAVIAERMTSNEARRRENHELDHPSCGCVFKNDRAFGAPSGRLIDAAGLKGYTVGGAQVSPHHANFVINLGHATAADLRAVIEHVRRTVHAETGHLMDPEVRFLGEF